MPSVRPKGSHLEQEVSPLGVAWLILGLVLASFWGGALRVVGSDRHIRHWVLQQIEREQPRVRIDFAGAHLRLARGLVPALGVEFSGLRVASVDPCELGFRLTVDYFFVPLRPLHFLRGQVSARQVEADNLDLQILHPKCSAKDPRRLKSVTPGGIDLPLLGVATASSGRSWAREVRGTLMWLDGLRVNGLRVSEQVFGEDPPWSIDVQDFHLNGASDRESFEMSLRAKVSEGRWAPFFPEAMTLQGRGDLEGFSFEAALPMREGGLRFTGEIEPNRGAYTIKYHAEQLPLGVLVSGLSEFGYFRHGFHPRREWFSARGVLSGYWDLRGDSTLEVEEALLDGEIGRMRAGPLKIQRLSEPWADAPYKVEISSLDLAQVLEALGREGWRGVVHQFGVMEGSLELSGPEDWRFLGVLRDLQVRFSRGRERLNQILSRIEGEWVFSKKRFSAEMREFELMGGALEGRVTLNLDPLLQSGIFQIDISRLELSAPIRTLMLGGDAGSLALVGEGKMDHGQLIEATGEVGLSHVKTPHLDAKDLRLKLDLDQGRIKAVLRSPEMRLFWRNLWHGQLDQVAAEMGLSEEPLVLLGASVQAEIMSGGGRWLKGQAQLLNGSWILASQGQWDSDSVIDGWLMLESPRKLNRRWRLHGAWADPSLLREAR